LDTDLSISGLTADDADQSRNHEEEGAAAELETGLCRGSVKVQEFSGLQHSNMKKSGAPGTLQELDLE